MGNKLPLPFPSWVLVNNYFYFSALKLYANTFNTLQCSFLTEMNIDWAMRIWGAGEMNKSSTLLLLGVTCVCFAVPTWQIKNVYNLWRGHPLLFPLLNGQQAHMEDTCTHTCRQIIHTHQKGKSKTNVNEKVYSMGLIRFPWPFSLKNSHCSFSPAISALCVLFKSHIPVTEMILANFDVYEKSDYVDSNCQTDFSIK